MEMEKDDRVVPRDLTCIAASAEAKDHPLSPHATNALSIREKPIRMNIFHLQDNMY